MKKLSVSALLPSALLWTAALAAACDGNTPPVDGGSGGSADAGDDDEDAGATDEDAGAIDDDGGNAEEDAGSPGEDGGASDAGADGGGPVVTGDADVVARLLYNNQRVFREDDFFARGGIATLELHDPQPLPEDDRTEFFNDDGERCTLESGTEWPLLLADGSTWPEGPFYNGGNLSLTVTGAPGPVVYSHLDTYYVRQSPGPVQLGNITYNSFFPPEYLPHGGSIEFAAAGGPDVGAFSFAYMTLAADYTVSAPNLVEGGDVINTDEALTVSWSPAAPGDTMSVIVKDSFSFIKCVFDDDGEGVVPAAAMAQLIGGQFVRITVQTWREHTDDTKVVAADGKVVDVKFTSRHTQIGRFDSL